MAEQLIISDPKPSVQTRLRAAGLVPAGTQRSSSTRVAVSATICEYCHNKFGPFCCTQGITPFATPNCLTNLGAGGISTIDGVNTTKPRAVVDRRRKAVYEQSSISAGTNSCSE